MNNAPTIFTDAAQKAKIAQTIINYLRLPFASDTVPGALLEAIFANIHNGAVLPTYDFADVIIPQSIGWQVKSTKSSTPVTWMRAKIPDKEALIKRSEESQKNATKKEQLPAFVARGKSSNAKQFAWHGRGEIQLHFVGEKEWWPAAGEENRLDFTAPTAKNKISFETIADWLAQLPMEGD